MTLQQPLATGQVTHDSVTRSLLVKPAERAWAWLIWQRGHTALMQDDGSINGPRPVFARLGHRDVGRGEAVRDGWVRFKLSDADTGSWPASRTWARSSQLTVGPADSSVSRYVAAFEYGRCGPCPVAAGSI